MRPTCLRPKTGCWCSNESNHESTHIKLSLAGALLAAGRGGLVARLSYKARWKVLFHGEELHGQPPSGVPQSNGSNIESPTNDSGPNPNPAPFQIRLNQ